VIAAAEIADPITATALREGKWVVDHTVAPPLLGAAAAIDEDKTAAEDTGSLRDRAIGDDPFADAAQAITYAERAVRATAVGRFNPDDIEYNANDDPWAADGEIDLEDQGIQRFDTGQPPLPRPAQRGQAQALPSVSHFRKMAIYLKGGQLDEIKEQVSLSDRREFRRAEEGRAADFFLKMREAAKEGAVDGELRERKMNYKVLTRGDVEISLPGDATEGLLADVLPMLKNLFAFKFIGSDSPITIPGGSPLPIPSGSPSPAVSP
jgi:hypothetical protein